LTAAAACTSTETRIAGAARQRRPFRLFVMVVVFRIASPCRFPFVHSAPDAGSQTTSPASTVDAPTLQLKLILFSSRLEKSIDTRSPGRTGRMNLADLI